MKFNKYKYKILLIFTLVIFLRVFYFNAWDILFTPFELIIPREKYPLYDLSHDGKYGVTYGGGLIDMEEGKKIILNHRLGGFINNNLIMRSVFPNRVDNSNNFALDLYSLEWIPVSYSENFIGGGEEISNILDSGNEVYLQSNRRIIIVKYEPFGGYDLSIYYFSLEKQDQFSEIELIVQKTDSWRCDYIRICISPDGKYKLTRGFLIEEINGEFMFDINGWLNQFSPRLFSKNINTIGWGSDSKGIYAIYGPESVIKGGWVLPDVISLPQVIIKIPIPFP